MTYSERLEIRLTEEEKALIVKAAFKREMKLSEFIRTTLKEAAAYYARES